MQLQRLLPALLLIGCTDYQFKNIDSPNSGADGENSETESNEQLDTATPEPNEEETEDEEDCVEEYTGFDINEFSTLQDAVSHSVAGWNNDAVMISFDDSSLSAEQTWRVSAVEILVMISVDHFEHFTDGQEIHIQLFDSNTPTTGANWTMTQQVIRSEHQWSDYTLPADAWYAGTYGEFAQKGAWFRFDTRTVVPPSGMTSADFIAGVMWNPPGMVKVGYSNFNQDCSRNWTDYGSGWQLNSENPAYFGCSWPMMRIEFEVTTPGDCE